MPTDMNYRRLRPHHVARYARLMAKGRWVYTGEFIDFGPDGYVVDGQHRLHACVESGCSFRADVRYNVPAEIIEVKDDGVVRNPSDFAHSRGHRNASDLMAWSAKVLAWKIGQLWGSSARWPFDKFDQMDLIEGNPDRAEAAGSVGWRIRSAIGIPRSMASAFYWLAAEVDNEDADRFCDLLCTGLGLDADDPIYALRQWAINRKVNSQSTTPEEWAHVFTKAWNKWRNNEPMRLMRVSITGRGSSRTPLPDLV